MAYSAVAVEGLFPSDLLERIGGGDGVDGQSPSDFGLPVGARLTDELQSAYSDVRAHWDAFQRRRAHSQASLTTITREAWVAPLLERLGYALTFQRSATVDGEPFVISHRAGTAEDAPPVNVVSIEQDLEARADGSRRTPHAAVQEYLNRTDVVWGIVTNGERLRLLRNAARISRPTYLEFDLRAVVEDNLYSEFVLFYRLLHRTRLPRTTADTESWIERYYQQGLEQGGRVRERLRDGVEHAISTLANGLLAHPTSGALRERVASGELVTDDLYRQLLRLVYRLLFLIVVEERKLVVPTGAAGSGPDVYLRHYGLSALRDRADRFIASDRHSDLWQRLIRVFAVFRDEELASALGLKPFDGELFSATACADLEAATCANDALLRAIRALSTFDDDGVRRRVNFAALDVEELGSVYEALLDYAPRIDADVQPPRFVFEAGAERRSTGSYYTPQALVQELVEAALVPVMEERLAAAKDAGARESALLGLRLLDLASGSGHFLLAAGRRIARELANARAVSNEPSPSDFRHALRDVIRSCLYGVDKNPLAVDLCKVALWLESHEAGLPLAFLDHRVKLGDSLLGVANLAVLDEGIPDQAYERADRTLRLRSRTLRDRNRREREGQLRLVAEPRALYPDPASVVEAIIREPDDTVARVRDHEARYARTREAGGAWWRERVACDLWAAPFFADVRGPVPTTALLQAFRASDLADVEGLDGAMATAARYRVFHWPVEFPDVAAAGGFDVVLSNPPFMGGKTVSGDLGLEYLGYLFATHNGASGVVDLCAYFLRRGYDLLKHGGRVGMVATKTIGQGDTRQSGLAVVLNAGGTITFAHRFIKWPGSANVEVNLLALRRGPKSGEPLLVDARTAKSVPFISSRLEAEAESETLTLRQNDGKAFIGSVILGTGFTMPPEDARRLIDSDPKNGDCLYPYLTGEDLNSRHDQSPSRWVINFFDWPLSKAEEYPDLLEIVRERVKPQRDTVKRERYRNLWWQYAEICPGLYAAIAPLSRLLVRAQTSETHALCFVPKGYVYAMMCVAFAFDDYYHFGLLQSNVHEVWVRRNASTMRADVRYTPSDCFDTFPFPADNPVVRPEVERVAELYDEQRRDLMYRRRIGLTKTQNLMHDPKCHESDVERLRELHASLDCAVAASYGWGDLALGHGFHRNERDQVRFTIAPDARRGLIDRLLALNNEVARREQEVDEAPRRGRI